MNKTKMKNRLIVVTEVDFSRINLNSKKIIYYMSSSTAKVL